MFFRSEDDGGGGPSDDDVEAEEVHGEDSSDSYFDRPGDDTNYLGDLGVDYGDRDAPSNPWGLSLGADEYIDRIDKLQDDVDRYSPRDYYDGRSDFYQPDIPLGGETGAPRSGQNEAPAPQPQAQLDTTIPIGPFGLRFSTGPEGTTLGGQFQLGFKVGKVGIDVHVGVDFNVTKPEKSQFVEGVTLPYVGTYELGLSYEDVRDGIIDYAELCYREALRELNYPNSSGTNIRNQY